MFRLAGGCGIWQKGRESLLLGRGVVAGGFPGIAVALALRGSVPGKRFGYADHFAKPSQSKFSLHVWVQRKLKSSLHSITHLFPGTDPLKARATAIPGNPPATNISSAAEDYPHSVSSFCYIVLTKYKKQRTFLCYH